MAYQIRRINPIDNEPNKAVGLAYPFNAGSVFRSTYDSREAIKVNLVNLLFTGKGERFLNPSFGSSVRNLLFEQVGSDKEAELRNEVDSLIGTYFPQVRVDDLIVERERGTLRVRLVYSLPDYGLSDNLDLQLSDA